VIKCKRSSIETIRSISRYVHNPEIPVYPDFRVKGKMEWIERPEDVSDLTLEDPPDESGKTM
jgi:hypothetical protein